MNNFDGIIKEYPRVAVDCFDGDSLKCTVFFLSHCHSDHMKGLERDPFYFRLKSSSDIRLYCSKVTSDLLVGDSKFKHLKPMMTVLEVEHTTTVPVPGENDQNESILVTLLPAGHCPGSVMFLFEGRAGNVLYTGDFRLTISNLKQMQALFVGERIKHICKMYVDTTFCTLKATQLPTRTQSRDALFKLLDPWLADGGDHAVHLSCPAQFGCEYLFVELSQRYKMKIHVTRNKMWKYEAVPEILEAVTVDSCETQLHACYYKGRRNIPDETVEGSANHDRVLPCEFGIRKPRRVLHVRFSTMWFTAYESAGNGLVHSFCDDSHRVCYSMHSSYKEIANFVQFLKPLSLHPLVIPQGSNLEDVYHLLKLDLEELSSPEEVLLVSKQFGSLKNEYLASSMENGTVDSDLIFNSESLSSASPKNAHQPSAVSELETGSPNWKLLISPLKETNDSQKDSVPSDMVDDEAENDSESISSTASKKRRKVRRPSAVSEQDTDSPEWTSLISPKKEVANLYNQPAFSDIGNSGLENDAESLSTILPKQVQKFSTDSEHKANSLERKPLISHLKEANDSQKDASSEVMILGVKNDSGSLMSTTSKLRRKRRRPSVVSEDDIGNSKQVLRMSPMKEVDDSRKGLVPSFVADPDLENNSELISTTPQLKKKEDTQQPSIVPSSDRRSLMFPMKETSKSQKDLGSSDVVILDQENYLEPLCTTPKKRRKVRIPSEVSGNDVCAPKWTLLISPMKENAGMESDSTPSIEWIDAESQSSKCSTNYDPAVQESLELNMDVVSSHTNEGVDASGASVSSPNKVNGLLRSATQVDISESPLTDAITSYATETNIEDPDGRKVFSGTAMTNVGPSRETASSFYAWTSDEGVQKDHISLVQVTTISDTGFSAAQKGTADQTSSKTTGNGCMLSLEYKSNSPEVIDLAVTDDDDDVTMVQEEDAEVVDDWDSTPDLDVILIKSSL